MRNPTDTLMDAALRDLDPAPSTDLSAAERARADAMLARIVATPTDMPLAVDPARPRRRRGLLTAVGLAGAAGAVVPTLLLGGGSAYGSWTPTPEALTGAAAATAATTCRGALDVPRGKEHVALAERRGDWTYVLLAGSGTEAVCLMPDDLVGKDPAGRDDFFGSYDAGAVAPPVLARDGLDETTAMDGSTDEGWFAWVQGYVGSDVTGVTVHTSSGLDIEASVAGGRFAAWWPSVQQSSAHPAETWSYTVHLAGGGSRRVG